MLQQTTIPRTPEEIAMRLSDLTEKEQCLVKGFIAGLTERIPPTSPRQSAERPSA